MYNKRAVLTTEDKKTIQKLIRRDEKMLFKFYRVHKKPLMNFILQRLNSRQDAEEVLQDSFIGFIESLRDFRGKSSLKTFLYSIAKRKVIDKLRKKKVKRILFSHFPEGVVESLATVLLDPELETAALAKSIEDVLKKLPNDYATVLRLKYRDGYKVAEIAEKINLSFKATESLIFRARQAFVKVYEREL